MCHWFLPPRVSLPLLKHSLFKLFLQSAFDRKLQEDLTDGMVDLAMQLKESSLLMSQSIKNTEKVSFIVLMLEHQNLLVFYGMCLRFI